MHKFHAPIYTSHYCTCTAMIMYTQPYTVKSTNFMLPIYTCHFTLLFTHVRAHKAERDLHPQACSHQYTCTVAMFLVYTALSYCISVFVGMGERGWKSRGEMRTYTCTLAYWCAVSSLYIGGHTGTHSSNQNPEKQELPQLMGPHQSIDSINEQKR